MAAPIGNNFWTTRTKHGRDRVIQDPAILWQSACEYFQLCIANPWLKTEYKGSEVQEVLVPLPQVFQKGGLALYCGLVQWRSVEELKAVSEGFSQVIREIEEIIYSQKFSGASAGVFNSNIIARDLGLADKREQENKGAVQLITITKSFISPEDEQKFNNE